MKDPKAKWQEANDQIMAALDIRAEYEALGVDVSGTEPTAKGWLYCHAFGREDANPSAGIHVGDGPLRGRYKDFAGPTPGKTYGLFDFAATVAGRFGGSWKEARKYYAQRAGVKLPDSSDDSSLDRLTLSAPPPTAKLFYTKGKPGITMEAMDAVGVVAGRWPDTAAAENQNHVFCVPMYGSALLDGDPTGYQIFARHPGQQVRKYQGKGRDVSRHKTLTLGEPGLMGAEALANLAEADVIIVVEGVTDLMATQAAILNWRIEHPDGRRYVVISGGSCSYHPKAELMHLFAGKEVWIIFDVGDKDNAGQVGAAVWVSQVIKVAEIVRNVRLPLGPDEGKNDLRDYFSREGDAHSFEDLVRLASTFEELDLDDPMANVTKEDAILSAIKLVVLGEHEGSTKIEVCSNVTKKSATINDIDRLTFTKLIALCGMEVVDENVHDGTEPPPGKYLVKDVRNAIAAHAAGKMFGGEERLGSGVWEIGDEMAVVRAQELRLFRPGAEPRLLYDTSYGGKLIDLSQESRNWGDMERIARYYAQAADFSFCQDAFSEAVAILATWKWKNPRAPELVAALATAAWLQSFWEWRPLVAFTGPTFCGKSVLLGDFLKPFYNGLDFYVQKPTEAAIRQHIKHHSRVMLIDEFEGDQYRQKVLELFRTSGRGGEVARGTAEQRGTTFRMRHLPFVAAIELGLHDAADANRFITFEMEVIPQERRAMSLPDTGKMADLGLRLLAVAMQHYKTVRELARGLKGVPAPGAPGRALDSFGVPYGMIAAIWGEPIDSARLSLERILAKWNFGLQNKSDEFELLRQIMVSPVWVNGGATYSVSQILNNPNRDFDATEADQALQRCGLRWFTPHGSIDQFLFVDSTAVLKNLLKGSSFDGKVIDTYLLRIKGADRKQVQCAGCRTRGVVIPRESMSQILGWETADNGEGERLVEVEGRP